METSPTRKSSASLASTGDPRSIPIARNAVATELPAAQTVIAAASAPPADNSLSRGPLPEPVPYAVLDAQSGGVAGNRRSTRQTRLIAERRQKAYSRPERRPDDPDEAHADIEV